MENLVIPPPLPDPTFWRGRRVFLTGHTGFKGSWLALWLHQLGAEVSAYALPPATTPSLYELAGIERTLTSRIGDIRDPQALAAALAAARPQIILHLAAQALVSEGYADPGGTYATNVMGTLNLLEAARRQPGIEAIVVVTTDKCYENRESEHAYRETDPLGGHDPYSSSKACTEILVASWRRSFFSGSGQASIATARAGNVIGGGDWAGNRLVPDLLAAFAAGETAVLRHPAAVRPWQHVLEPLGGYLLLAERLTADPALAGAWNFGPELEDCVSVGTVADKVAALWPTPARWQSQPSSLPHEAGLLRLDASHAREKLGWQPRWRLDRALEQTVAWHIAWQEGVDMGDFCRQQIEAYGGPATALQTEQP
ncbi:MAG: CDP-glucose 4,6-dehydratase [Azospira sp.]|jgi:CDP-glucose 4,6-dehydratase|nr:CDP-glucose 4,6-dehydratase [Azospira sp.]